MINKTIVLMGVMFFAATCFGAETKNEKDSPVKKLDKNSAEYWIVRSQAMTELTPFLTTTRTEAKVHYTALTDYLVFIGKGQEFARSDIKAPLNPVEYARAIGKTEDFVEKNIDLPGKPFTWNELVEFAMEFIIEEGYIPTDVDGKKEIEMIKKISQQKEKYGKKVRDDLRKIAQECLDMKAYLESIDQFEECVKYTRYQKAEKERAKKERQREGKDYLAARERDRREGQKQNEWRDRQKRIHNRYYYRGGRGYRHSYYRW